MPFDAQVFKVVIGSPSDVGSDREVIASAINQWNNENAEERGIVLLPIRWEIDTYPVFGVRPQSGVNEQIIDHSDILVAVFWTRLGRDPAPDELGRTWESGTAEEINRFAESGKKVLIYFSQAPYNPQKIDPVQLHKLMAFREEIRNKAITADIEDFREFEFRLRTDLTNTVRSLGGNIRSGRDHSAGKPQLPSATQPTDALTQLEAELRVAVAAIEVIWDAQKEAGTNSIDDAKQLLTQLQQILADFVSRSEVRSRPILLKSLQAVLREIPSLAQLRLLIDGGKSHGDFWRKGNELFSYLQGINTLLEAAGSLTVDLIGSDDLAMLRQRAACLEMSVGSTAGIEPGTESVGVVVKVTNTGMAPAFAVHLAVSDAYSTLIDAAPATIDALPNGEVASFQLAFPHDNYSQTARLREYYMQLTYRDAIGAGASFAVLHLQRPLIDAYTVTMPHGSWSNSPLCGLP